MTTYNVDDTNIIPYSGPIHNYIYATSSIHSGSGTVKKTLYYNYNLSLSLFVVFDVDALVGVVMVILLELTTPPCAES